MISADILKRFLQNFLCKFSQESLQQFVLYIFVWNACGVPPQVPCFLCELKGFHSEISLKITSKIVSGFFFQEFPQKVFVNFYYEFRNISPGLSKGWLEVIFRGFLRSTIRDCLNYYFVIFMQFIGELLKTFWRNIWTYSARISKDIPGDISNGTAGKISQKNPWGNFCTSHWRNFSLLRKSL